MTAVLQQEAVQRPGQGGRHDDRQGERPGEAQVVVEDGDQITAEQQQGAVGEVEHARGLEDDDEAEGDQRVHRAEGQSAQQAVQEIGHAASSPVASVPR